jgi:menaquinol-cytochrome c reductase iron-sulfur subunit
MSQHSPANPGPPGHDFSIPAEPRRGFFKQFLAVVIGGVVGLVPAAVGLVTFFNPLRKSVKEKQSPGGSDVDGFYKVAPLDSLSDAPQVYKIIADRKDAWNTFRNEAIGPVYLQRVASGEVRAFNGFCPHAGCLVDFRAGIKSYVCPCHNSSFAADGRRDPSSPSARDLDTLETKIIDGTVCVKFQNFKAGDKEKKPA